MELTEDQKQSVAQWVDEGCGLSEIQKRMSSELGVTLTYMDVRFLIIDLGLDLAGDEEEEQEDQPHEEPSLSEAVEPDGMSSPGGPEASGFPPEDFGGAVSVEVDRIMKPGALVSGTVSFSDGASGTWSVDQFGRLGLDMGSPDYKPSQDDLLAFQAKLKSALASRGMG